MAMLAGCGGGGGGSTPPTGGGGGGTTPTPVPTTTATPGANATGTDVVTAGSTSFLSLGPVGPNSQTAVAHFPAPQSGSGTLTGTLTETDPGPALSSMKRHPAAINPASAGTCGFVQITSTATIVFPAGTTTQFTTSGCSGSTFYIAVYDANNPSLGWQTVAGPVTANGNVVVLTLPAVEFLVNDTYTLALYTPTSNSTTPTPSPQPSATLAACNAYERGPRGQRRMVAHSAMPSVVPNRIFVDYKSAPRTAASVEVRNVTHDFAFKHNALSHVLTFASAADAQAATATLKADANVAAVNPVHYRRLAADSVADDKLLDNIDEWYMYRTHVDTGTASTSAWGVTHGATAVEIAIIDTGFDETNTDINSKIDYKESDISGTQTTGNGSVQDSEGHGTNVAGLAIAQPNNESVPGNGFDSTAFAGVGWNVHMLAYKIFPDSTASCEEPDADTADEITAIDSAVSHGASVISMSLGGSDLDTDEQSAVEAAISAGVTVVAANGNEYDGSGDGASSDYPAGYAGVVAVGASAVTDDNAGNSYSAITGDKVASYSNSGPTLVAPGGDPSSDTDQDTLHWIEGYDTSTGGDANLQCSTGYPSMTDNVCAVLFAGTSQATPQVAGTVGLMLSEAGGAKSLTPAVVKQKLINASVLISGVSATRQGAGLLNAYTAVSSVAP